MAKRVAKTAVMEAPVASPVPVTPAIPAAITAGVPAAAKKVAAFDPKAALLASGAVKKSEKSSSVPNVNIPELDEYIQRYVDLMRESNDKKAEADILKADIAERAEAARVEVSRGKHDVVSSLRLNGKVTYGTQAKTCVIPQDKEGEIMAICPDKMGYFPTVYDVKVKSEDGIDQKTYEAMVAMAASLGKQVGELFEIKMVLKPTPAWYTDKVLRPEIFALAQQLKDAGLVKPYEASLKVK